MMGIATTNAIISSHCIVLISLLVLPTHPSSYLHYQLTTALVTLASAVIPISILQKHLNYLSTPNALSIL